MAATGTGGPGDLAARAANAVAGFTSTRSKTPEAMFGGLPADTGAPTHVVRAAGARVVTADGRALLDWTMALGAVALGYGHPRVVEAAERAVRDGAVGPLPPALEVEIAERLCAAYPVATGERGGGAREGAQARFFKTGAEAVQAAVRLARAATGRERVVYSGYHGWLDGPTGGAGVPHAVESLWCRVPFDDVAALEAAVASGEPPAVVLLEPVIERAPSQPWLAAARELAAARGAVLVFDEIKTAFRLARGGAAERWGVRPDVAVLGKALANGFPLAAVVGRRAVMAAARDTWISSTLATEYVSFAAARAVLDVWGEVDVARHLGEIGRELQDAVRGEGARGGFEVVGMPEMFFLRFADPARERRFLSAAAERGVLLKRGAYDFPSLAHGRAEVEETAAAVRASVAALG